MQFFLPLSKLKGVYSSEAISKLNCVTSAQCEIVVVNEPCLVCITLCTTRFIADRTTSQLNKMIKLYSSWLLGFMKTERILFPSCDSDSQLGPPILSSRF